MTTVFLSFVLVSGYLFVINALPLRYRFKRAEGWGAYFFVAAWGLTFFILSWVICSLLSCLNFPDFLGRILHLDAVTSNKLIPLAADGSKVKFGQEIASWAVFAMFLAFICGIGVQKWYERPMRKHATLLSVAKSNPVEELLIEASLTAFSMKITMKSKKVYVGIARKPTLEHGKLDYISLIPLLSGCRSDKEHRVHFYTNYHNHYQNFGVYTGVSLMKLDHYRVVLPVSEIDNVSLFDMSTYINFNKKPEDPTKLDIQG